VAATQSWDAVSRSEDTAKVCFWARVAFAFLFCFLLDFRSELIEARSTENVSARKLQGLLFRDGENLGESLE
jgi:hypothetical protein